MSGRTDPEASATRWLAIDRCRGRCRVRRVPGAAVGGASSRTGSSDHQPCRGLGIRGLHHGVRRAPLTLVMEHENPL